jgi:hypothetical protein
MAPDAQWVLLPSGQRMSGEWIDDTLRDRVTESGLLARTPLVGDFPRQRVEVIRDADDSEVSNLFYARGWTDGLPIVPPTIGRVEDMLRYATQPANAALGELDPLKGVASVEKLAANAVMAGCAPRYFPVVLAAVQAIVMPEFNLRGVQTTDENVAPLLVVSGPIAAQLNLNGSYGALGPGWKANATIGRALRLIMNNIGGGWPGAVSFAGIGQPGRYTMCLAENGAESPWEPLHVEHGIVADESAVTITRAESAVNVTGGLAEIADVMGSAASLFAIYHNGVVAVALAPAVAKQLAKDGWSKDDVKKHLWETGRLGSEMWRRSWLHKDLAAANQWPDWVHEAAETGSIPPVRDPDDITIFVAGGTIPIAQHVYFPSWGFPPCRIVQPITLPPDWDRLIEQDTESKLS